MHCGFFVTLKNGCSICKSPLWDKVGRAPMIEYYHQVKEEFQNDYSSLYYRISLRRAGISVKK